MEEETHGSIPHRSTYYGLEAIFKDWFSVDLQKLYTEGGMDGVKSHYSKVSKKLGYEMKPTEAEINNLGYRLMGSGAKEKALKLFLENIKLYPNSFNVYDSAAEAYMVTKQDKLAIKNYKKSLSLNPGNTNGVDMLKKMGVDFDLKDQAVELTEKEQNEYVGNYDVDAGGVLNIQIVDGNLTATHPAIPKQTMHYYSNNVFLLLPQNVPLKFVRDDQQNPTSFEVQMSIGVFVKGTKKKE
jgi:D-alanyl-D-alanine-carboxypeptidase/D-alanyl-D-alanine-endopeptidase